MVTAELKPFEGVGAYLLAEPASFCCQALWSTTPGDGHPQPEHIPPVEATAIAVLGHKDPAVVLVCEDHLRELQRRCGDQSEWQWVPIALLQEIKPLLQKLLEL